MRLAIDSVSTSPSSPDAGANPLALRLRRLTAAERLAEAEDFIRQFHAETGHDEAACERRLAEVRRSLSTTGHYDHTADELAFGARVAWRNHARCIGRLFWKSLVVHDRREVEDPAEIAACCAEHLAGARAGGGIRSTITIFAPARAGRMPAHIESRQLVQYAGYLAEDGSVAGDPANIEATNEALALGWEPPSPRGRFDVLPLQIRDAEGRRHLFEYPEGVVEEIAISHPHAPAVAALGLRWYSVPAVSSMVLSIGGIDYPCAPFNGFYMASEIASRNFADATRYDMLAAAAEALGIAAEGALWRDRVLTELNEAVLHSFRAAGATILDHHAASAQFMEFFQKERLAGREPSADWSWIVPPQSAAACPVYHLPMQDRHLVPNYYASGDADGAALGRAGSGVSPRSEPDAAEVAEERMSRCPFARSLGLLARTLRRPLAHPSSLNAL
jgi:nitric-oxide synthase